MHLSIPWSSMQSWEMVLPRYSNSSTTSTCPSFSPSCTDLGATLCMHAGRTAMTFVFPALTDNPIIPTQTSLSSFRTSCSASIESLTKARSSAYSRSLTLTSSLNSCYPLVDKHFRHANLFLTVTWKLHITLFLSWWITATSILTPGCWATPELIVYLNNLFIHFTTSDVG